MINFISVIVICIGYAHAHKSVTIEGNHGCPFHIVASNVAFTLHSLDLAPNVLIKRGGQRHLPDFDSPEVSLDWLNQYWIDNNATITNSWNYSSPRVILNNQDEQALDCSSFLLQYSDVLEGANATLGLARPINTDQWQTIRDGGGCSAVWIPAYCQSVQMGDMFKVDIQDAVRNDISGNIIYQDIGLEGGTFAPRNNWRPTPDWCQQHL